MAKNLFNPEIIIERKREGQRILDAAKQRKHLKRKRKAKIPKSNLIYDNDTNEFLSRVILNIEAEKTIRRYIAKHRAGITTPSILMNEIRHNFSNYEDILDEAEMRFKNNKKTAAFRKVLKKELNQLITDTYKCFPQLKDYKLGWLNW